MRYVRLAPSKAAAYERHVYYWQDCTQCPLHNCRSRVVLFRGFIPCRLLLIGEAPGESEDCLGYPFVGPSGKLLNELLPAALEQAGYTYRATDDSSPALDKELRWGITNVVACLPTDTNGNIRQPLPEEIQTCGARLEEIVRLCAPELIGLVGKVSTGSFRNTLKRLQFKPRVVSLQHPAFLLRDTVNQPYRKRVWINELADALTLL